MAVQTPRSGISLFYYGISNPIAHAAVQRQAVPGVPRGAGRPNRRHNAVVDPALHIELPAWLVEAVRSCPDLADDEARMAFVIGLAADNVSRHSGGPFAAAVFESTGGRLLAAATNLVVGSHCAAAHAEMLALSLAQRAAGSHDLAAPGLPGCDLVSSAEPCLMCSGAVLWSGVRRLLYAANDADVRAIGFDEGPKHPGWQDEFRRRGVAVVGGLLREPACRVLSDYRDGGGVLYNGRGMG